ncbi:MAG: hypothetical protein JSW39_26945 [Desulfobacterales bacterium]|nr:MAG: hypothetical protein JSW39_26945 [Desulfobacterales bacterium]
MELKAGTLDDFNNSMAAAIESAFERVWSDRMGTPLPDETRDDRRMMFVAIAQGVIRHLKDNAVQGFDVDVAVGQTVGGTSGGPLMASTGDTTTGVHFHDVEVTQTNTAGNMIQSEGRGTVTIVTTGELYP